jgi:hypothetical protein
MAAAAMRERNQRLRQEADAALAERDRIESQALLAEISAMAEKKLAIFRDLPCGGEVARIGYCSDFCAANCQQRQSPSCPRSIVAFDAQREMDALQERLDMSGVPKGIRSVLAASFEPTEATQAVDAFLASEKRLLLLAGNFGTGKSVAAGYAIKRRPGRWMHASEIKKAARFEHEARMTELQTCRLLVIDDLGSEFNDGTGWARAALTELLLVRYDEGLLTIMTSNLDGKAWKAYADPRVADRLGGTLGQVFGTAGVSRRKRA